MDEDYGKPLVQQPQTVTGTRGESAESATQDRGRIQVSVDNEDGMVRGDEGKVGLLEADSVGLHRG